MLEIIDLREAHKLAYQTCRWSVLKATKDGPTKKDWRQYVAIFERQRDGRWLIKVKMCNNDEYPASTKNDANSVVTR